MTTAYFLTVTLHVLATLVWLGGMLFFALIAPILRDIEDDALRASLFGSLGRRLRTVGWVCIAVLLATGVGQLHLRGWWGGAFWGTPGFWGSALGSALAWKFGLVAMMLTVQGVHDFWLGPAAGRARAGSEEARSLRMRAAWLARANALFALLLVYFAVKVARGG
ncbi:MAG: CopD family protein [Gemmatimonadetes bacterium]|nr:CopD family protein [Gemmatimonadota bacterium]MCH7562607.1 CopD family protein [Gemmatimonadota bacterium]